VCWDHYPSISLSVSRRHHWLYLSFSSHFNFLFDSLRWNKLANSLFLGVQQTSDDNSLSYKPGHGYNGSKPLLLTDVKPGLPIQVRVDSQYLPPLPSANSVKSYAASTLLKQLILQRCIQHCKSRKKYSISHVLISSCSLTIQSILYTTVIQQPSHHVHGRSWLPVIAIRYIVIYFSRLSPNWSNLYW